MEKAKIFFFVSLGCAALLGSISLVRVAYLATDTLSRLETSLNTALEAATEKTFSKQETNEITSRWLPLKDWQGGYHSATDLLLDTYSGDTFVWQGLMKGWLPAMGKKPKKH